MLDWDNSDQHGKAMSFGPHRFEVLGYICVVLFVLLGLRIVFGFLNMPYAQFFALGATGLFVWAWIVLRLRTSKKHKAEAVALRQQLHELKEQEFALRFEEARLNGSLNAWEKKK